MSENIIETLIDSSIDTINLLVKCTSNLLKLNTPKEKSYNWDYFFKEVGLIKNDKVPIYCDFIKEDFFNVYVFKVPHSITVDNFKSIEKNISYFLDKKVNDLRLEQIRNKVYIRVRNEIEMKFNYEPTKMKGFKIPLGVDIRNPKTIIYHDLISSSNCHMLLGGSTGSGKSFLLRLILCNLIYSKSLRDLQLILINTKYTDLKAFKDVKQCISYIEGTKATMDVLGAQIEEIDRRYKIISKANCDDIREYREKVKYMPYRVIVLEEFSSYNKNSEGKTNNKFYNLIEEIVARGRASGVLLITTMQLSSSELVPSHIKNNINTTLGGKCKDKYKSITLCGEDGLEKLKGDGQFKLYDSKNYGKEFQSYLVNKETLKLIIDKNKRVAKGSNFNNSDNEIN